MQKIGVVMSYRWGNHKEKQKGILCGCEEKDLKKEEKKKKKKMTVTGMQESQAKIILATKIPAVVSFLN